MEYYGTNLDTIPDFNTEYLQNPYYLNQTSPCIDAGTTDFSMFEQPDYKPFFIDFEGTDLPKEVGLFIENICLGGAKVIEKTVEVPGYILAGMPDNKEIEFRLYFDNKSCDMVPDYSTFNQQTGEYENKPIQFSSEKDFYQVKINTDGNHNSSLPKVYISNYPNPFTPYTTIEYYVPKDSDISIDIFNVKGEKVKN